MSSSCTFTFSLVDDNSRWVIDIRLIAQGSLNQLTTRSNLQYRLCNFSWHRKPNPSLNEQAHASPENYKRSLSHQAKSKNEKNYFGSNIIEKTRSRFAKKGAKKVEQRNDESNEWRLKIIRGQLWRPISQKRGLKERRIFGLPIILKKNFEVQKKQLWDINERPWVRTPPGAGLLFTIL